MIFSALLTLIARKSESEKKAQMNGLFSSTKIVMFSNMLWHRNKNKEVQKIKRNKLRSLKI